MGKITSKNTNRALRDTNADKTTDLLSHLRNNYVFIVGYCCYPTHRFYLQYHLALIRSSEVTRGLSQGDAQCHISPTLPPQDAYKGPPNGDF